ncbi:MAG: type II secretion system protein [Actinomycetota bacterium]|nr:type II secretion system protein [Actinomycetota bacterium]
MRYFRNEKGFTLIELMVVILIIGILVAIAVPVFNSARQSAYDRTCQANLRILDGAVETWKAANPTSPYPKNMTELEAALVPDYVKSIPVCPMDGDSYTVTGDGNTAPSITCPNEHHYK